MARQHRTFRTTGADRGSTAPVGEYLTDQLLLPLALTGSGSYRSIGLSRHATTHIELIARFLDLAVRTEPVGERGQGTLVTLGASHDSAAALGVDGSL